MKELVKAAWQQVTLKFVFFEQWFRGRLVDELR